jgi:hypothetical protein
MPTENEIKFVLKLNCEDQIVKNSDKSYFIKQGYFNEKGPAVRIREISAKNEKPVFIFGFKCFSNNRVIEIEKHINSKDYRDLWEKTIIRLEKKRYEIVFTRKDLSYLWVVDFFKTNEENYFCLAEYELFNFELEPAFIPDIITRNLIYQAKQGDNSFSSRKLANVNYATELYKKLT